MMKFLQKLGKAIMIPVACLPLCGILMGLGYLLCPVSMQGGAVTGIGAIFGLYLVKAGGALIDNIAILFAVGIGVGMADNEDRIAGIAALISWLMIVNLLNADFVRTIASAFVSDAPALLAFQKIENPFIGIIAGLVGAGCYNRFKDTRLPEWLAFFSGKRSTLIAAGLGGESGRVPGEDRVGCGQAERHSPETARCEQSGEARLDVQNGPGRWYQADL